MTRRDFLPRLLAPLALPLLPARADDTASKTDAPPVVLPLKGGATLIVLHDKNEPLAVIDAFFRVGFADEDVEGASGLLALMTRAWIGASEMRGEATIFRDIGRIGGNIGARFGGDWTELFVVSAAEEATFDRAAQTLLLNLVALPAFTPEAIERGRNLLLQDIAAEKDGLLPATLRRLQARAWDKLPYSRSPLASEERARRVTGPQVAAFHKKYFRPERLVVVVAGGIAPETAKSVVESNLGAGGWLAGSPAPKPAAFLPETLSPTLRPLAEARISPAQMVAAGFLAGGTANNTQEYTTLLVLDALWGGGKGARLFRTLRDTEGLSYDTGTALVPHRDQSLWAAFVFGASAEPLAVRDRLVGTLRDAAQTVTDAELARAKAFLRGKFLRERQRLKDKAFFLGWAEVMGLGWEWETNFVRRTEAVTADEAKTLAAKVLAQNPAVVYTGRG